MPETQKNSSEKSSSNNAATKSKSRTSIQQLLSEPDPALIKTMKRCDSEHIRSASNNVNARGRNGRNHPGNNSNNTASRTVPTTPGKSIFDFKGLAHSVRSLFNLISF